MEVDYRTRSNWPSLEASNNAVQSCNRAPSSFCAPAKLSAKQAPDANSALNVSKILSSARQLLAQQQELHSSLAALDNQAQRLRGAKGADLLRPTISNTKDSFTGSESRSLGESSAESIPDHEAIARQASSADVLSSADKAQAGPSTAANAEAKPPSSQCTAWQSASGGTLPQSRSTLPQQLPHISEMRADDLLLPTSDQGHDIKYESAEVIKVDVSTLAKRKRLPIPVAIDEEGNERALTPKETRRLRRRITNRESAHRMRAKRQEELDIVQREAQSMSHENAKLRGYIEQLENEQHSLAQEMVNWQTRWKSTAAKNVRLYHELVTTQQHRAALLDSYAMPPPPATPTSRLMTAGSAPYGLGSFSRAMSGGGLDVPLMRDEALEDPLAAVRIPVRT
ncbi:hypothetical protein WJX73_007701 [Symbiochloris irregularis]|uniref:BZIP domain-containing protein n=1 Tax=Symbiochloris irregularis TaxID=706552 RepID=A0AAW1NNG2_9CHLO